MKWLINLFLKKKELKSERTVIVQKNPIKKIFVKISSFKLILPI